MKLRYIGDNTLFESFLLEDKQIKLGGEMSPNYGWCVIYLGGPASGKSTLTEINLDIQGKLLDVDSFKDVNWLKKGKEKYNNDTISKYYDEIEDVVGEETMKQGTSNPEYTGTAHTVMKPLTKKAKKQQLNIGKYNNKETLPNIIFDMVGDELDKIDNIINKVKPYGYKVALIWVFAAPEDAWHRFHNRERKIDDSIFFVKHEGVIKTVEELFHDSDTLDKIDDFWVIDASSNNKPLTVKGPDGKKDEYESRKAKWGAEGANRDVNVYHIPTTRDGLNKFELVSKRIMDYKKFLNK